jgi:hypothetical protein
MNDSGLVASILTVLLVLALVIYRLLWGALQAAAIVALGRFRFPRGLQHWLFGEPSQRSNYSV